MSDPQHPERNNLLVVIGVALVAFGAWMMALRLDLIPRFVQDAWYEARGAKSAIALILIGVVLILLARSGSHLRMPEKGTRLYKSRSDKWVFGVLGGFAKYLGVDATLVRLGYLAIALVVDFGTALIVYVVLSIVIPDEPKNVPVAPSAPAAPPAPPPPQDPIVPNPPVPPAPPSPPFA